MRWKTILFAVLLACAAQHTNAVLAADSVGPAIDFNREVRPILADKCFRCHGPDAEHREADLRFDVESSAKGDLGGYRAILPGHPDRSELIHRISSREDDTRMPPPEAGKQLSANEIMLLRRWIEQGAPWSEHWAYVHPQRQQIPQVRNSDWPSNWIDQFILSRLHSEGLRPSPDADRVTLIRRLSFDLTGLPPAPDQVDRFVDHADPGTYEKIVDELLQSQQYGERMAMYWLDLVRYADTVGYHGDQEHHISPYRDYVIDAFNDNMPLDQFTREQLAGDLLPDCGIDQKIASGYNRLLQTSHEGGVQAKEYLAIYAADRVRNLSAVWMGATMGCCQCHDHKYDPLTTKDFYSMAAFFSDIDEASHLKKGVDRTPTIRAPEINVLTKRERQRVAELDGQVSMLKQRLATLTSQEQALAESLRQQIRQAQQQQDDLEKAARLTMITVSIEPRTQRILPRGNWLDDSGPIVEPAVPEFLGKLGNDHRRATRLDLANWLTDAETGAGRLTARVFANRFWYLLFGSGLARDLDDFGRQGEAPVHPRLLDNLAIELVQGGWNVKQMMKLLVMSRTYRQSSLEPAHLRQRDPDNRLYARQSRFRLPAEMIRDNALAISGLLVHDYGGGSIRPYQPDGYYRHLNFPPRTYEHHADRRQWRRGVYVHWQRQFLHPMLKALDAPMREECTAQRHHSNTPIAAMTLLNDPTFVEAARVFAERIVRQGGPTTLDRLNFSCRLAVSRTPDARQRLLLTELFNSSLQQYAFDVQAAKQLVSTGQAPVPEDLEIAELAAWTTVARAILNMNETITRN